MSDRTIPDLVRQNLENVISLCDEHNIPEKNLRRDEFVPNELRKEYDDLRDAVRDHSDISWFKVQRYIGDHVTIDLDAESKFYLWDIAVTQKRNLALQTYPELAENTENGLIRIPSTAEMNKNGFEYENHFLIFDTRFSQNFHLVDFLNNLRQDEIELYAPITFHRLGLPNTTRKMMLKEHWAGPQTVDHLQQTRAPEFIQKGSESYEDGVMDRTEFYFDTRDGDWHIQIEELLPQTGVRYSPHTNLQGNDLKFYTRYVHAILDSDCETCFHLDGAFRAYETKKRFIQRHTDIDLRHPNRLKEMSSRHKLFKIDSEEGFSDYQEAIGLFLKHNPHVTEFFEGASKETKELEQRRSQLIRSFFESDTVDIF